MSHGSWDHFNLLYIAKITFNLDIKSTDKPCSTVSNVDRVLLNIKVLILGSKEINTNNDTDIYDNHKDLYLGEKEREEKLLQGMHSANGLKTQIG